MIETYHYDQILYNQAIFELEQKWGRKLDEHERHIVIEAYRIGRAVEMESITKSEY